MTYPHPPSLPLVRLKETSVAEGNILEHPIFKLSNKEARPTRGKDKDGNALLVAEDYRNQYELAPGVRVVVEADMHHGFPTIYAMRVFLAVLDKARELGFPSPRVPIGCAEIARKLGDDDPGGHQFRYLKQAMLALTGTKLVFEHAWHDAASKTTIANTGAEHLVASFSLGRGDDAPRDQLSFRYTEQDYVELGPRLFESLRAGYRIGVDLDYLNHLKTPTAQRLYAYLTKKDGDGRVEYSESICSLAKKLPLATAFPSQIRRILEPALVELEAPQASGKRFLGYHGFERTGRDTLLLVRFAGASLRETVRTLAEHQPP